jgi:hypothetical protein
MFCEGGAMQLSAANLLIASQQIARGATQPSPDARAQFTAALAKEKGVDSASFEPMDFKQSAPTAKATPAAPAQTPSAGYGGAMRLGANIDIRV